MVFAKRCPLKTIFTSLLTLLHYSLFDIFGSTNGLWKLPQVLPQIGTLKCQLKACIVTVVDASHLTVKKIKSEALAITKLCLSISIRQKSGHNMDYAG